MTKIRPGRKPNRLLEGDDIILAFLRAACIDDQVDDDKAQRWIAAHPEYRTEALEFLGVEQPIVPDALPTDVKSIGPLSQAERQRRYRERRDMRSVDVTAENHALLVRLCADKNRSLNEVLRELLTLANAPTRVA